MLPRRNPNDRETRHPYRVTAVTATSSQRTHAASLDPTLLGASVSKDRTLNAGTSAHTTPRRVAAGSGPGPPGAAPGRRDGPSDPNRPAADPRRQRRRSGLGRRRGGGSVLRGQ